MLQLEVHNQQLKNIIKKETMGTVEVPMTENQRKFDFTKYAENVFKVNIEIN